MPFVKLDQGILDSTLWVDREARDAFITALLLADPFDTEQPLAQLEIRSLNRTGFVVPAGWYGLVRAAGVGIIRRAMLDEEAGLAALERLGAPDPQSRSSAFDGRRLVRVDGGFIILNFMRFRERDYTAAARARRYREQIASRRDERASRRNITQAEAEAEKETLTPLSGGSAPDDVRTAKKRQARAIAVRAIEHLNAKAGTKFKAVEANVKLPTARVLYDGASEEDLRAVVDLKVAEAERGEFDRKYLRPATLFNAEKFAQYIGQAGARAPSKRNGQPTPTKAEVYFELQDGKLVAMAEYPIGPHLEVARTCARDYASRIARGAVRNVMIRIGQEQRRFTINELNGGG